MLKTLLAGALALCLSACGLAPALLGGLAGGPAPQAVQTASAPLARVSFDESAYRTALAGADVIRASIDVIIARGGLVRNSPAALRVRQGLIALRDSLRAGGALLDALNDPVTELSAAEIAEKARQYRAAMAAAQTAAEEIREALSSRAEGVRDPAIDAALADLGRLRAQDPAALAGQIDATLATLN